jgi:hypothetical protein
MYQYYVQVIARNYLQNVVDQPDEIEVHPSFLFGTEVEDFVGGYNELLSTVKKIYADIQNDPKRFDMLLKEVTDIDSKAPDYLQSHSSFLRVPNLLFLIGLGDLQSDLSINLAGEKVTSVSKELKISKILALFNILSDFGFEVSGLNSTIKEGDIINISFPQNRYLMVALKAISEAMFAISKHDYKKSKDWFYMMDYHILKSEKPKEPKLTVDYIYHALDKEKSQIAKVFNDFISQYAKPAIRMGGFSRNDWAGTYSLNTNKTVIMSLQVSQDKLSVKLNLNHINQYIDAVKDYPEDIINTIKTSGWSCVSCRGNCAGPVLFEYESKKYNKCRCGCFLFEDIKKDNIEYCIELLKKELQTIGA